MCSHSPGRTKARVCQRASGTGRSASTWLIENVPSTALAAPGASAPIPTACPATSCAPVTTGVPSARPVSAAAAAVTVPHTSALPVIGGSADASPGNP
jgi:hypothetical protein